VELAAQIHSVRLVHNQLLPRIFLQTFVIVRGKATVTWTLWVTTPWNTELLRPSFSTSTGTHCWIPAHLPFTVTVGRLMT
jgi:hypothetical protein